MDWLCPNLDYAHFIVFFRYFSLERDVGYGYDYGYGSYGEGYARMNFDVVLIIIGEQCAAF